MRRAGINRRELCSKTGIVYGSLRKWIEHSETQNNCFPRSHNIQRLCLALPCTASELMLFKDAEELLFKEDFLEMKKRTRQPDLWGRVLAIKNSRGLSWEEVRLRLKAKRTVIVNFYMIKKAWNEGKHINTSYFTILRLCKVFNVNPDVLFGWEQFESSLVKEPRKMHGSASVALPVGEKNA